MPVAVIPWYLKMMKLYRSTPANRARKQIGTGTYVATNGGGLGSRNSSERFFCGRCFRPVPINGEECDLALRFGIAPQFIQVTKPMTFAYREHAPSAMKDFGRTVAGAQSLISAEQGGQYPGGASRARERWRILARHIRPVTLECLDRRRWRDAWD